MMNDTSLLILGIETRMNEMSQLIQNLVNSDQTESSMNYIAEYSKEYLALKEKLRGVYAVLKFDSTPDNEDIPF
jgi:hypothetical protein